MKFLSDILAKAGLTVDGVVTLNNTATGQTPDANDNSTKLATTAWVRTFVQPYSLPIASASVLGGVKVGSGLSINSSTGVLSVTGGGAASIKSTQTFIATAGQTVFTISGGYTAGLIDVFLNGVYLSPNQTTATNGTTVTLSDAALVGDIIDVIVAAPIYQGATTTTDQLPEGVVNLYYTNARARAAISLTVTGTSGASTYDSGTGVLNIPTYTLAGLGGVPTGRTLTIDGVSYDLSANRTWNILPTGGAAGDILAKNSATNYDVTWIPNYTSQVQHTVKLAQDMTIGTPVYVSGSTGQAGTNMLVSKASNVSEGTSSKTLGLIAFSGVTNDTGFVITEGLLAGLDTSAAGAAGDPVWLGPSGTLIYGLLNKPYAPAHLVFIGVVTRVQQNNGEIFVKVQNGYELEELHNLSVASPSDGDMIKYVASTGLWTKIAATTTNITEGTNLYYTQARFDTAFAAKSTTNLAEGTNLYYTDSRARAAISVTGSGSYDSATGIITVTGGVTSVNTLTGAVTLTTTNIGEGTNLYYTTARVNSDFDTRLATKSTTNLAEGTNLYYTDARVGSYLSTNSYATQSYVSTQIANLVASAPAALDTLNELAAALGNDASFSTTISTALGNRLRVDIGTQGLTSTQQGYGRTNLGLGSLATLSSIGNSYITDLAYSKLTGVPTSFIPSAHTHVWADITDRPTNLSAFTNGPGYITGITSGMVTSALGYTPANSSHTQAWSTITSTPTTLSGYGISDGLYTTTSDFTTAGAGWYRVATTSGDGRGYYFVEVYCTGGNHNPAYLRIEAMGDWGSDKLIAAYTDLGFPASSVRITRGATNTFLEVYFTTTILGASMRVTRLGFNSGTTSYSGSLPGGGDTVKETLSITSKINTASLSINGNDVLHAGNYTSYAVPTSRTITINGTAYDLSANRSWTISSSAAWADIVGGVRDNYTLVFQAPSNSYAGFEFRGTNGIWAGYFLIRGTSDNDVYTAEGITLVADQGWLTLAQRTASGKGVRIMTGTTSATRVSVTDSTTYIANNLGVGTGSPSGKFHVDHADTYHMGILHTYDSTYVTTTKFGRPSTSSHLAITYDIAGSEIAYINRAYSVARLLFQRAGTTDLEITGAGALLSQGYQVVHAGNVGSYALTSETIGTGNTSGVSGAKYQINDTWLRVNSDDRQFQMYGNSRVMIYRTDGNTNPHGGGGYAHLFYYGGSADSQRVFIINTDGRLYSPYHGWLDTMSVSYASSAGNANTVGSVGIGSIVRKDTTGQYLRDYYEYGSYLSNELPSTLVSQMSGSGGLRIDFGGSTYTATGSWSHILTWSGYNRYSMCQIGSNYYTTDARLYYRQTNNHDDAWASWKEFAFKGDAANFTSLSTSGIADFGPNSGADNGIGIRYGSTGYGRIRFWQDGSNHSTIHSFGQSNYSPSDGKINIDGQYGVTFGAWNDPDMTLFKGTKGFNLGNSVKFRWGNNNTPTLGLALGDYGTALHIEVSDNDTGGLVISNDATTVYGAGDSGFVFRVIDEDSFQGGGGAEANTCFKVNQGAGGGGYMRGDFTATGDVTAYSDIRVKENIKPLTSALSKVLELNGYYYNRTDLKDKSTKIGFIAQEVKNVVPELVTYDSLQDRYAVSYGNATALLVEAIKEQQAQIESQKTEIEELKDLVKQLINR